MVRKVRTKKYGKRKHRRSLKRKSKKSRHFRKRHMHKSKKRRQKGGNPVAIPLYVLYIYLDSEDAGPGFARKNLPNLFIKMNSTKNYIENGMEGCMSNYNSKIAKANTKIDIAKCNADYEICKYDSTIEENQTEENAAEKKAAEEEKLMQLMTKGMNGTPADDNDKFGQTANAAATLCIYWQAHRQEHGEFIELPKPGDTLHQLLGFLRTARENETLMTGMVAKMLRNYEEDIRDWKNRDLFPGVKLVSRI